jgi:hypothetical protein
MAKMSSKMAKYGSGSGPNLFTSLVNIIIYIVVAYILYRVVMYIVNMRSSAMPNLPDYSSNKNKQKGGCSSGTCGGN